MNDLGFLSLLLLVPSLFLLLKLSAPADSPARIIAHAASSLRARESRIYLLTLLAVLAVDLVLTAFDGTFTTIVGHDFAFEILALEGKAVAVVQGWTDLSPSVSSLSGSTSSSTPSFSSRSSWFSSGGRKRLCCFDSRGPSS